MPSDFARRGRPRGSGLDDRVKLQRIVELIEADPNLKPTTAIKAIGVSDPSTIRRLRDKLKSPERPSGASFHDQSSFHEQSLGGQSSGGLSPVRADAWLPAGPVSAGRHALAGTAHETPCAGPETFSQAQLSWLLQWCAFGLSAVSSTVEAQMAVMDDLLRVPQVESALRQQLLLNEVAKAFCPKRSRPRTPLH